jgi:hypothetical protein
MYCIFIILSFIDVLSQVTVSLLIVVIMKRTTWLTVVIIELHRVLSSNYLIWFIQNLSNILLAMWTPYVDEIIEVSSG